MNRGLLQTTASVQFKDQTIPFSLDLRKKTYICIILFTFSFLLYLNTIPHEYALDDATVISKNRFTQMGIRGIIPILSHDTMAGEHGNDIDFVLGGRYRPLSVVLLAFEYELFGANPHINHFVNILLYSINIVIIFIVLADLFTNSKIEPFDTQWYYAIAFIASVLYAAHPIHTEVVANIKGRDEIMTMLFALVAFKLILTYLDSDNILFLFLSFIAFFLSLLSKENGITFIAIIPSAIYFFKDKPIKKNLISLVPLVLAALIFLYLRSKIIGSWRPADYYNLLNNPFVNATESQRFATIAYTLLLYLKLLLFPHPLTWDYYPYHIPLYNWNSYKPVFALLIYLSMISYVIITLRNRNNIISWSIILYLSALSIVSNIFFVVGVFMSERFIYISSLGFTIILAYLLVCVLPSCFKRITRFRTMRYSIFLNFALGMILVLYSFKTISRNTVWKNNFTLFTNDVLISNNSAKSLYTAGEQLLKKAVDEKDGSKSVEYFSLSKKYLQRAIEIYPRYRPAILDLGVLYEKFHKDIPSALYCYKFSFLLKPGYDKALNNINALFQNNPDIDLQINTFEELYSIAPDNFDVNYFLGKLYFFYRKDFNKSIFHLERAIQINPSKINAFKDLGIVLGSTENFEKAIIAFESARKLSPLDPSIYSDLSICYRKLGKIEKAAEMDEVAKQLKKKTF